MSTATSSPSRLRRRALAVAAAATLATALAVAPGTAASAAPVAPPTPCPSGQTSATSSPSSTTPPAGETPATTCALAPPTAMPAPSVAPEHVVGGPRLAGTGVVVDPASAAVPAPPEVNDAAYLVADMSTGDVLAAKDPHGWLLPASTLKTLTSLVVMPAVPMSTTVVATDSEVGADGTRVGMVSGATYSVGDLFHGLVLMSGNDTAYALADAYGGRDKTVAAMNAKAAELGAWDTVAVDPSGLDAPGQRSSVYDLALFGRAVMQLPDYRTIATTRTYTFPGGTDASGKVSAPFEIQNHNQLLENYPGTIGVKNGYTTGARNTFIGAVTRGDRTLLITEMGSLTPPTWKGQAALLDWAFANVAQLRPVGSLVAPGAAQPPELGGPAPTASAGATAATGGSSTPGAGGSQPSRTAVSADALAAPAPGAVGGNPVPWLLTSAGTAARHPVTWAVVAALVLLAVLALRRRGRGVRVSRGTPDAPPS